MKKQSITKILLTMLISMMGANAFAADIEVKNADGVTIYYNYINDTKELEVTFASNISYYRGDIVIPEEVTYMNRTRKVTSIGDKAFSHCTGLTSVTIPNSVTSIGSSSFYECSRLTAVSIPNSVTSIGSSAFVGCTGLTSVTIGNSVTSIGGSAFYKCESLTSVTIPNSVTSIGEAAFCFCYGLTSVTIGNSVTSIGGYAFFDCQGLTSVTIPNSVTSIGDKAFSECYGLTSVTIPNSVTSIGVEAFLDCYGLTSVTIPNSVTSIGNGVFYYCSSLTSMTIPNSVTSIGEEAFAYTGLTSVTIPNSVTSIGSSAFEYCKSLTSVTIGNRVTSIGSRAFNGMDVPIVISLIENPFKLYDGTFSNNTLINATLYVPVGTIDKYKATNGWKDFLFIEEGTGPNGGGGETPETKTCATPTIGYQNGKLTFNCETEGATCQFTITDDDINSGSANEIQLGVTYRISVYATKDGYDNSETATATLCWIDVEPKMEGITNSVANVRALPLLIQSNGSTLTVSGADDGTSIAVYSINGTQAGSAISQNGAAIIPTSLQSSSAAIVKVGDKAIKVEMK